MDVHEVAQILTGLTELQISSATTDDEAMASMRLLQRFNRCDVGLVRFSGRTPWERHSEDELLYLLEGEVELTVLLDGGEECARVRAGSVVVVPRDRWHRQETASRTTLLFVTGERNETSYAEDPRVGG
jgi:quercetin dioxygenase-like cupin family protein